MFNKESGSNVRLNLEPTSNVRLDFEEGSSVRLEICFFRIFKYGSNVRLERFL